MKELKLAYSKIIPFSGFYAINLFGVIIRRMKYKGHPLRKITKNHEGIHTCQAEDFIPNKNNKEWKRILGYCIFYIFYFIEWLIKAIISLFTGFKVKAYRSISFEQEAYKNQDNLYYQNIRKHFTWIKYIFKLIR